MTFRRTVQTLATTLVAAAALLAAAPALADDTCELPTDCVPYYEAYARGWMSGGSISSGRAQLNNSGPVDVCIDDFLFWTSMTTQTAFIDSSVVGAPEGVIPAGGHITLHYGSWSTNNGHYQPYLGQPRWWCAENGQLFTGGGGFDWFGDTIPTPILDIVDNPADSDGDGRPDTAEWWGAYGVQAQYSIWSYQELASVFTVGKLAVEGDPGTVDVTLTVRNLGELPGTGVVTDTLPAGAVAYDYTLAPDSEVLEADGTTTLTWSVSLAGFMDPANMSADTVYTSEQIIYTLTVPADADHGRFELAAASVEYFDGAAWYTGDSQPALAYDLDADGDGYTACGGDCDDSDAAIFPGATELCDGFDNDCDGEVDEGFDSDGDGWTTCDGDCDDTDPSVNPGAWEGPRTAPYAAASWESTWQGLRNNGTPVGPLRSNPDTALTHEPLDIEGGFYSLGFGGEITVVFDAAVTNGPGDDVLVWEKTYGPYSPYPTETADVFAWDAAGATWVLLGEASNEPSSSRSNVDNSFDLGALTSTTKLLIVDTTDPCLHSGDADGFDVNGVDALQDGGSTCDGIDNDCDGVVDEGYDVDGDGWTTCEGDCDDGDAAINPDATEVCNGVDDDCDGVLSGDELDDDGDGMAECDGDCDDTDDSIYDGAPELCDGIDNDCDGVVPGDELDDDGDGLAECQGDCDDADAANFPGNTEVCDGQDNDCDADIDEGFDVDGDGFTSCAGDCDDADANNYPGNAEVCDGGDNDCDGAADEGFDADGDGFVICAGDCDDSAADVYPGAPELCDGIDNDCDGAVPMDELDLDSDGWSECDGDCEPWDGDVNPDAFEECDGIDNDCDGAVDEGYDDINGNGVADCTETCNDGEAIFVSAGDGTTQVVSPNAGDAVLTWDQNNRWTADIPGAEWIWDMWFEDTPQTGGVVEFERLISLPDYATVTGAHLVMSADNAYEIEVDGFAAGGSPIETNYFGEQYYDLTALFGPGDNTVLWIVDNWPQSGGNAYTNPGGLLYELTVTWEGTAIGPEVCDGIDNDCDGVIPADELDADADGFMVCDGDCDDANADVYPGAVEECDGLDNDCDGVVPADELDADGDGYRVCDGDCDDADAGVYLGAAEICDGVDNDCDGTVDEGYDTDGDGWTTCGGDCDDADADVNPGALEECNGVDDDCDGVLGAGEVDLDGDGFSACEGDCNDAEAGMYPGAEEICDGLDNDCDGVISDSEYDFDGDGVAWCNDCNDGDPTIYPGAPEYCDNIDTDCDGAADNGFDDDGDGIPDCVDECPMVIDIDTDPWDEAIAAGVDAGDAYQSWGVTIEKFIDPSMTVAEPATAWDSGAPSIGDEDKGTPGEDFGGPGIGFGGEAGTPGENAVALSNLMKGDEETNTWWLVNFSSSTCVHSIDFVDVDTDELPAQVILFDVNVQTIATVDSLPLGDNSVQTLDLGGVCGVYVMMIDFYGGGGWDNLVVCVDPDGVQEICDDGIDNDGDGFIDEDCEPPAGDDDDDDDDDAAGDDDDDECDDDWDGWEWDCNSSFSGRSATPVSVLFLALALVGLIRRRA